MLEGFWIKSDIKESNPFSAFYNEELIEKLKKTYGFSEISITVQQFLFYSVLLLSVGPLIIGLAFTII